MIIDLEKKLANFDYKNISVNEIEKLFSREILGHSRPTIKISTKGLFRARIISNVAEKDLETVKSIWYPDFKEIDEKHHKLNRCSNKGQNFFYSSNSLEAVIKELEPKDNDLIMIGIFHTSNPEIKIRSQYAGIEVLKKISRKSLQNYLYPTKNDELIEKYISSKFQKKIENDEEYKSSIAFSNILLKNDEINCIIYPSVASNLKLINFGIKADFVDDFLFCKSVYIYKVRKTSSQYELLSIKFGKRIYIDQNNTKNSTIYWEENTTLDKQHITNFNIET